MFTTTFLITKNYQKELKNMLSIASTKNLSPICSNFKITTNQVNQTVEIAATNLEMNAVLTIPATVVSSESFLVPAKEFVSMIEKTKKMPAILIAEPLPLENRVKFLIGGFEVHFLAADLEQFPIIPQYSDVEKHHITEGVIGSEAMQKALSKTAPFICKESNRPILSGILMSNSSSEMSFVSTNGKQIAEVRTTSDSKGEFQIILQPQACQFLSKSLSNVNDSPVNFRIKYSDAEKNIPKAIMLKYGNVCLSTHVIEGKYPDYKRVLVQDEAIGMKVTFNIEELIQNLEALKPHVVSETNKIHIEFDERNRANLCVRDNQGNMIVSKSMEYESEKAKRFITSLNVCFMIELAKVQKDHETITLNFPSKYETIEDQPVKTDFLDSGAPIMMHQVMETYLLMPLRAA